MKNLIRRLSRVADSSQQLNSLAAAAVVRRAAPSRVPEGHVPVHVGDEMERFVVRAELLNHPIFVGLLLNRSVREYGYSQKGVLHIPCRLLLFERVVDTLLRFGIDAGGAARELHDLITSFSVDDFPLSLVEPTE